MKTKIFKILLLFYFFLLIFYLIFPPKIFAQFFPEEILNISFLNQKYPFFYEKNEFLKVSESNREFKWEYFEGIEHDIIDRYIKPINAKVILTSYEPSKNYDIVLGSVIKSKTQEKLFSSYAFCQYFSDDLIVYTNDKNCSDIECLKTAEQETIGILMYSYSYYLLKEILPKTRVYAYQQDLINDFIAKKLKFIIVDKFFFSLPEDEAENFNLLGVLYSEKLGILIDKNKIHLIKNIEKIIDSYSFEEIKKWFK